MHDEIENNSNKGQVTNENFIGSSISQEISLENQPLQDESGQILNHENTLILNHVNAQGIKEKYIQESIVPESLSSSDALAVILTYFIRNNILPKKEVDDSATQLIEFFKDPERLNR